MLLSMLGGCSFMLFEEPCPVPQSDDTAVPEDSGEPVDTGDTGDTGANILAGAPQRGLTGAEK